MSYDDWKTQAPDDDPRVDWECIEDFVFCGWCGHPEGHEHNCPLRED